jgi:ribosome-associated protein
MNPTELKDFICKLLDDKKGVDIIGINVNGKTILCDYFILATGTNVQHVKALCDHVLEETAKRFGLRPKTREGYADGRWIVLDYGDVVAHIFNEETRLFYYLERLWQNGDNIEKYHAPETPKAAAPKPKRAAKPKAAATADAEAEPPKPATVKPKRTTKPKTAAIADTEK